MNQPATATAHDMESPENASVRPAAAQGRRRGPAEYRQDLGRGGFGWCHASSTSSDTNNPRRRPPGTRRPRGRRRRGLQRRRAEAPDRLRAATATNVRQAERNRRDGLGVPGGAQRRCGPHRPADATRGASAEWARGGSLEASSWADRAFSFAGGGCWQKDLPGYDARSPSSWSITICSLLSDYGQYRPLICII